MMSRTVLGGVALLAGLVVVPAFAQGEADFVAAFAGDWQTLDPAFSENGACRVTLDPAAVQPGRYRLAAANCGGALAGVSGWAIVDNQLGLVRADGAVAARLGGNQNRMSGDTDGGGTVVFERLPAGAAAVPASAAPASASCIYYGYTASCASPADLAAPKASPTDPVIRASVLVRLNARAEARPDAPVVATIPADTCVVVEQCTTASDGLWCRAKVADYTGWIRQQSLRQNRWPVLTFTGSCMANAM